MTTNVYFIQSEIGGPVKIGKAVRPDWRLRELQTGNPYTLKILMLIRNCPSWVETFLHEEFSDYSIRGEWFDPYVLSDIYYLQNLVQSVADGDYEAFEVLCPSLKDQVLTEKLTF